MHEYTHEILIKVCCYNRRFFYGEK